MIQHFSFLLLFHRPLNSRLINISPTSRVPHAHTLVAANHSRINGGTPTEGKVIIH